MFANHLPRIGVLYGNSGSAGCVRGGGRSMPSCYLLYTFMVLFVALQACFHLVGVIDVLSVGNGI